MSDNAKKKAATAVKQASHAAANLEEAAVLQAEEIAGQAYEALPGTSRTKPLLIGAGLGVVGTAATLTATHYALKAWHGSQAKRQAKKAAKNAKKRVEDELV